MPHAAALLQISHTRLSLLCRLQFYTPGEQLVRAGAVGKDLTFLLRGSCIVLTDDNQVGRAIGEGNFFGEVALMPAVSVASGIVATSVAQGAEVLIPEGEFTSIVFPFLAAQERGLLAVREAPLKSLAEAIGPQTEP